jgi:hypothetical protein
VGLMGKKDGALLLDHGIALADSSLRGLVSRAYNVRLNARIQRMAITLAGTVNYFEAPVTALPAVTPGCTLSGITRGLLPR